MEQYKKDLRYIIIFGIIVYFTGNWLLPVTDPVECNYTLTAKEMLAANDWVSPQIFGNYWYDKPIFFYWELMTAFSIFGINDFAARFFPSCFTITALVITYLFGRKVIGERQAFCGTLILASSVAFMYLGKAIITDMSLFVFHSATLMAFYLGYRSKNRNLYYVSYAAAAFATLTKGPVGLALPGLTILVFLIIRRDFKEILKLKIIPGLILYFAIGGPWYYQMYTLHGMDFIGGFLGTHNVLRATVSEHPRDNVWWYYIMIFSASFVPWTFGLIKLRLPIFTKKFWAELPEERVFLLCWAFVTIGCYQMAATKYPTYTLPSTLPLALLWGCWLADREALVKKVAIGSAVFFMTAYCTIIPYYMDTNVTGRNDSALIEKHVGADELLLSVGNYRTSTVYYSGRTIYKLEHYWEVEEDAPSNMSWNAKNVMPFMGIEQLPLDKPVYIIVNINQADNFANLFPESIASYEVLDENATCKLVRLSYHGPVFDGEKFTNTTPETAEAYMNNLIRVREKIAALKQAQ